VSVALANLRAGIVESDARILCDPLPTVQANMLELTQVFQNLIGNAIKFRKPGVTPEIYVSARQVGGGSLGIGHVFRVSKGLRSP